MNDELIANVAVSTIADFFLSNGYIPSGGWDFNDPNCFKQYGPHIVITACGRATESAILDVDVLWEKFVDYILQHNSHITAVKFSPFKMERYDYPEASYLYLSLAQ